MDENDDHWKLNAPDLSKKIEVHVDLEENREGSLDNPLDNELADWGINIPNKLGSNEFTERQMEIPEIIKDLSDENRLGDLSEIDDVENILVDEDETTTFSLEELKQSDDLSLPSDEDLAYPSLVSNNDVAMSEDDLEYPDLASANENNKESDFKPSSKLISVDELNEKSEIVDDDVTDPAFEMTTDIKSDLEREVEKEISPEEFWAADEGGTNEGPLKEPEMMTSVNISSEEIAKSNLAAAAESELLIERSNRSRNTSLAAPNENKPTAGNLKIFEDEIIEEVKKSLDPLITQLVRDFCQKKVEEIAWEVIPDVAENIIRNEIKEIAKSTLDQDK